MTGQTEGAPAPLLGPSNGGCAFSLFCGGVGAGTSVNYRPSHHYDETGDLKPEYKYWRLYGYI